MSLSSELKNPDSIISKYLAEIMKPDAINHLLIRWNNHLAKQHTLKVHGDVDPANVGRAFDYAFRWHIAPEEFAKAELVAHIGAAKLGHTHIVNALIEWGQLHPEYRAQSCVILSWYENYYRQGTVHDAIKKVDESADITWLREQAPEAEIRDVQQLTDSIDSIWDTKLIDPIVLNPIMPNSRYVNGADGDWIIGNYLYDCKCSWKRRPFTEMHMKQVVAYALLDWDNKLNLEGLGWYFARQQTIIEYPIDMFINDLNKKRAELRNRLTEAYAHRLPSTKTLNAVVNDILWKHHEESVLLDDDDDEPMFRYGSEHFRDRW